VSPSVERPADVLRPRARSPPDRGGILRRPAGRGQAARASRCRPVLRRVPAAPAGRRPARLV